MRFLSSTLIASLLLNGIAVPTAARAEEDTSQACATDSFTPNPATKEGVPAACGTGQFAEHCRKTRENLITWSADYKKLAEQACQKRNQSLSEINELSQSSAHGEVKSKSEQGIADINSLIAANQKIRNAIPNQSEQNAAALEKISATQPRATQFRTSVGHLRRSWLRAKTRPEVFGTSNEGVRSADRTSLSSISDPKAQAEARVQMETLSQSQEFVKALLLEEKKNKDAVAKLNEARNNAIKNQNNTRTAENPGSSSKEGGFNPMSLLPLAAPLAGLLMQQQQQAAQDSGLSDTLPQSPDPYASAGPTPIAGTSLEPKGGSQSPGAKLEDTKKPDADMNMPVETYAGGGGAVEPFAGDISNGNGEGKSSALGAAGGFSANSGGGASDSSGGSTSPGKGDRKPANSGSAAASEDGLIGSGGGGGGYSASASTDSATEADGGMKDMLHDMESTLEDVPTGLFAEAEKQNSADGVGPENSESLFPRVRAAYVRNLKKGFVLNGLGEKLPESDSH